MGIELPAELTDVAAKAGVTWPKADEDAMRASATAWRDAGDKIKGLGTSSDGAANRALEGLTGSAGDAARGRWAKVVAPDGELQKAARGCHAAADRLDHAAQQVGAAKVEIVRELTTLAKNNDAAHASASAGNPNALLGLDTLTRGAAANVANLQSTLSSAIRLDSGVDMGQASPPVNTAPGAHGPGGGLPGPVGNLLGGVVAPVAGVVAPVVEAVAPVAGAVTAPVAPVVGAVTAPVAPLVGAVTAPVAPVVGGVTDAVAPVLDAAAPVTAPAAAVVAPVLDSTPGVRDAVGPVLDAVDGPGDGRGNGEGPGRGNGPGEGGPQVLPGLVTEVGQAVPQVVAPVADVIPSVQGTLGPIAENTTQASAAVLDPTLVRGAEMPGQTPAAPQAAAPAAQPAPAAPTLGGAPVGSLGGAVGAVGGAVGGVPSAAPAAGQLGAVVGQQQTPGQAQQGQAAQQTAAKSPEAKAAEAKVGEAKAAAQATAAKTGVPGAVSATGNQVGQAFGGQSGNQLPGQGSGQGPGQVGNQTPGQQGQGGNQAQQGQQGPGAGKDALAKDPAKDALKDALAKDPSLGDLGPDEATSGPQKVGETIAAPGAPVAGVDLGTVASAPAEQPPSLLTDRLENQALANPGVAYDVARHTFNAAAVGSWFMAIFLGSSQAPRLSPKPARQLPAPQQEEQQPTPRFAPQDHPQANLVDTAFPQPAATTEGLGKDHPIVQELMAGYDALAGMHERDWENLFANEDGSPRWPQEREGGYEDSRPEVLEEGAELDRFGTPEGRVLSALNTPYKERSLPPQAAEEGYHRYRVTRDLPVHRTISAPWFGQPGGGARYRTTYPVADLVALGYLTEITA